MSENLQRSDQSSHMEQKASHWAELVATVIERAIDKDLAITYTFDQLEIDVPSAHGPGGRELGGAKWVIDGKITIATAVHPSSSRTSGSTATSSTQSASSGTSKYT